MLKKAHRIAPWELGEIDINQYARKFLAEGDSWFSFGSFFGNSLLDELAFHDATLIVQTAMPGDTLSRMADWWRDPNFTNLLQGTTAWSWDGILISGGGNDLFNAMQADHPGRGILQLFAPGDVPATALDCIIEDAWSVFERYLRINFREISLRAAGSQLNATTPIFVHDYDFAVPRDAGAGFGKGPWLRPALQVHHIPEALWVPLMEELFGRLRQLVTTLALPNVFAVDTFGTLTRALPTDQGDTLHWLNEIHPNQAGYRLLGEKWRARIEEVLAPPP